MEIKENAPINPEAAVENKTSEIEIPLEVYKVGNLIFKCHCCKYEYTVEENVQGGIRFDLYATNKHRLSLACPQCKAVLEMYFTKGEESGIVDINGNAVPKSVKNKEYETAEEIDSNSTQEVIQYGENSDEISEEEKADIEEVINEIRISEESK